MAVSTNQQIVDALTTRHLQALRVETRHRRDVWAILTLLETDLLTAVKVQDPTAPRLLAWRRRRVEQLLEDEVEPLVTLRYAQLAAQTTAMLVALAQREAAGVRRVVNEATATETLSEAVPAAALRQRVTETLFPSGTRATDLSTTGAEWWQRLGASLQQRLGDQLLVGVSLEESLPTLVARLRGTPELGHTDGLMAKAKDDATRLLRTQTTHALSTARAVVAEGNTEEMVLLHVSTIDSRTSEICLSRDGLRFTAETHEPIGHAIPFLLGPPYHPNCRSIIETILREGGPVVRESLDAMLRRRGAAFQDEILGPARGQLFREGVLTSPRDLVDAASGRPLTLEELTP